MNKAAAARKPFTRFGEFELLKALAIMGLPCVHVMEEIIEGEFATGALNDFGALIIALCVIGPSVFMICMGFGIGNGKTSPDSVMRTGIQFLLIGALLNVVRWFIPGVIQMLVIHTPLIEDINYCLQSDIYYFVGLYFLMYSVLKRWNISSVGILMVSFITLSINTALTPFMQAHVTNEIAASLIGNIIYVDETSCFPLLSWAVFPTVGVLLGETLKKSDEEQRKFIMHRLVDASAVIMIATVVFLNDYGIDEVKVLVSPANEYITDFPNVAMLLSIAFILIGTAYLLCQHIGTSKFMAFILRISAFIVPFYLIQWILASWLVYIMTILRFPKHCFGLVPYFISVTIITVICIFVSTRYGMKIMKVLVKYTYFKKKRKKKKK